MLIVRHLLPVRDASKPIPHKMRIRAAAVRANSDNDATHERDCEPGPGFRFQLHQSALHTSLLTKWKRCPCLQGSGRSR